MTDQRSRWPGNTSEQIAPVKRLDGLETMNVVSELIVYDTQRHHIHQLNSTAATIWRLCDGRRTIEEIADEAARELGGRLDIEVVELAFAALSRAELINGPPDNKAIGQRRPRISRRLALKGTIALPVIVSMTAPTAQAGASDWVSDCYEYHDERYVGRLCSFDQGKTFGHCSQTGRNWWNIQCI